MWGEFRSVNEGRKDDNGIKSEGREGRPIGGPEGLESRRVKG